MIGLQNINGYGIEDGTLSLLKEIAQKYCPEEVQELRKDIIPDEILHLDHIKVDFDQLLTGGSSYSDLPYIGDKEPHTTTIPNENGFGIGIPETQKLRDFNYEETDTLSSE